MEINMAKDFLHFGKMIGVVCPDCGMSGANKYPCWCHRCHENGVKVLMLPSVNRKITSSWSELHKTLKLLEFRNS